MKFLTLILLATFNVQAQEVERTPDAFENTKIERKMEDGSTVEFSGADFMIVPRTKKKSTPKPEKKCEPEVVTKTETVVQLPPRNSLYVLAGYGPVGLRQPSPAYVDMQYDAVVGLGYSVLLDKTDFWRLHVQGLSNKTALIGIGKDFP